MQSFINYKQAIDRAQAGFESYPEKDILYVTRDGQVFFTEKQAKYHSNDKALPKPWRITFWEAKEVEPEGENLESEEGSEAVERVSVSPEDRAGIEPEPKEEAEPEPSNTTGKASAAKTPKK